MKIEQIEAAITALGITPRQTGAMVERAGANGNSVRYHIGPVWVHAGLLYVGDLEAKLVYAVDPSDITSVATSPKQQHAAKPAA